MSVYEISLILLDVFPGLSDLTLQEWTLGMCKCAVNFLPLCTNYPEMLSASPNVQGKKLQWCQKAALKSLTILRIYFACGVIQLCLKLVQLFTLVCKYKNRKYLENLGLYSNCNLKKKKKNSSNCGVWGLFHFYINAETADLCQDLPVENFKGIPFRQRVYSRIVEVPPWGSKGHC